MNTWLNDGQFAQIGRDIDISILVEAIMKQRRLKRRAPVSGTSGHFSPHLTQNVINQAIAVFTAIIPLKLFSRLCRNHLGFFSRL